MKHTNPHAKSGNILFLILLGVFLFGALTYSFTKTSRTGGATANLTEDKAELYASEVLQYASAIKEGIGRMQLLNGVKDYQFDMATGFEDYVMVGANLACSTNKCRLFHPEGGAVKPRYIPDEFYDPTAPPLATPLESVLNEVSFYSVAVDGVGSDANDLIMAIIGISKDVCNVINYKMSGISPATPLVDDIYGDWDNYSGNLTSFPDGAGIINDTLYKGKKAFCISHSSQKQIFVYVLLER